MQHCKQLKVQMMAEAARNISLIQITFSSPELENFTEWNAKKG
jgi:hypothetical protein